MAARPLRFTAASDEGLKPGMVVGLYGGSFDPPHRGHRHVAMTAMKRLGLDRVWWVVSPHNPLKPHAPEDLDARMDAVERLINHPRHVVTDIEARIGTRYTADLIAWLVTGYPGVRFVWIMGADGLGSFHRWQDWRAIAAHVPIVVVSRPGPSLKWRLGRGAREMAGARVCATQARKLVLSGAPGWTYITAPLHAEASSDLRRGR